MQRTSIEWTDYTLNPVTGCLRKCPYCYASALSKRFHRSFEPEFHPERLKGLAKAKAGDKVFICSMGDLFAEWIPSAWITEVLDAIREYPEVIVQLLTRSPTRYAEFAPLPENCWAGATVTKGTPPEVGWPDRVSKRVARVQWISAEPLMGEVAPSLGIDWVVVGAMSGALARKYAPDALWIGNLAAQCAFWGVPLFEKDSIRPYVERELVREFPE